MNGDAESSQHYIIQGNGTKGKCSNERGITVITSNVGKIFERMINNRAWEEATMTEEQGGGSKGKATTDHILTLKELININKQNKSNQTYIIFLNITKAYDKAWLEGIMYVMYKQGIRDQTWKIIKDLNTNITAKIKTKDGLTRPIIIKDSIRQEKVLSAL